MAVRRDQAIVLRLAEYSEASQVCTLLTRDTGQVRLIAKGVQRGTKTRFAVGLDLLERGDAGFSLPRGDTQLGILTEWVQTDTFRELRGDWRRLNAGLYALETAAALTQEHDPHVQLFDAIIELLESLADRKEPPAAAEGLPALRAVVRYQAELLRSIGFAPNLRQCTACGRPHKRGQPAWFSSRTGGLLCRDCCGTHPDRVVLHDRLLDPQQSRGAVREWFALLDGYLRDLAGREFRTAAVLIGADRDTRQIPRAQRGHRYNPPNA